MTREMTNCFKSGLPSFEKPCVISIAQHPGRLLHAYTHLEGLLRWYRYERSVLIRLWHATMYKFKYRSNSYRNMRNVSCEAIDFVFQKGKIGEVYKIKKLGWIPRYNFEDALKETIEWYRDNEW